MLGIKEAKAEEIVDIIKRVENGLELEDREIWIWKGYLG
jgi:hypothetical protein